jgi:glycosyltransferase involved in cell wall biosynthesis
VSYDPSRVAVAILTKNQAAGIAGIVEAIRPYTSELLVVDGHSEDDTQAEARRHGATVVVDGGRGKGDGVRAAIQAATREVLVMLDGDGSYAIGDIPALAGPVLANDADLVIASRMRGGSDQDHGTIGAAVLMFGNAGLSVLINSRFGTSLTDSQNGFRALRREAAAGLRLVECGAAIELELPLALLRRGYRVAEVPIHEYPRRFGTTSLDLRRDWFPLLRCLLKHLP